MIGKRQLFDESPSNFKSFNLNPFNYDNLIEISKKTKELQNFFQNFDKNLFEKLIKGIFLLTGGVPLLIYNVFVNLIKSKINNEIDIDYFLNIYMFNIFEKNIFENWGIFINFKDNSNFITKIFTLSYFEIPINKNSIIFGNEDELDFNIGIKIKLNKLSPSQLFLLSGAYLNEIKKDIFVGNLPPYLILFYQNILKDTNQNLPFLLKQQYLIENFELDKCDLFEELIKQCFIQKILCSKNNNLKNIFEFFNESTFENELIDEVIDNNFLPKIVENLSYLENSIESYFPKINMMKDIKLFINLKFVIEYFKSNKIKEIEVLDENNLEKKYNINDYNNENIFCNIFQYYKEISKFLNNKNININNYEIFFITLADFDKYIRNETIHYLLFSFLYNNIPKNTISRFKKGSHSMDIIYKFLKDILFQVKNEKNEIFIGKIYDECFKSYQSTRFIKKDFIFVFITNKLSISLEEYKSNDEDIISNEYCIIIKKILNLKVINFQLKQLY